MRGQLTRQPLQDEESFFLYNGEIFDGKPNIPAVVNDTVALHAYLKDDIMCIRDSEGPYALALVKNLQFSYLRDRLGRRSLLHHLPTHTCPVLFISSVWPRDLKEKVTEVQSGTLHTIDLTSTPLSISEQQIWMPYTFTREISHDSVTEQVIVSFQNTLQMAVRKRVLHLAVNALETPGKARVAILFSGGIDCTVIAVLACLTLPSEEPIDLLNVAFENPRTSKQLENIYNVPDRLTGRQSLKELQALFPTRILNLVEIDVTMEEALSKQVEILDLMAPQQTEMDYSIGMALYFASRGEGKLSGKPYKSIAKILLSGLGADELFGGYSRHRRAFRSGESERENWNALREEMQLDLQRIGSRNLGRDDRCISSHGKEARYPFLDEKLIQFACNLPLNHKCNLSLGEGHGDKFLLRKLAVRLGLREVAKLKKRAMQFGSRSAKRESNKTSGIDIIQR